MSRLRSWRTRDMIVALAILLTILAAAISYWSGGGSGSVSVTLGNPQNISIGPGTPGDPVSPGESAAVRAVATNPNTYEVHIASIALDTSRGSGGFDVDAGHSGCGLSALSFSTQNNGGAGWTVPPRVGATDGSLVIGMGTALTMSANASNACQGASFTVYLRASF